MTRRHESSQSSENTGRMGFRYDWEPVDIRPCIYYTRPFWESPEEESLWLRAVRACPMSEYGQMDLMAWLGEVGKVAVGLAGGAQSMPRAHMTRRERDERLSKLREQAKPDLPEWIEDRA